MKLHFVLAGMMTVALGSAQADTYRWVESSGKVQYGDMPPAASGVRIEHKKFSTLPEADNAGLPYETRHAQENFPVTLYTANNCKEPCSQARGFLDKRGIPYTEKLLVTQKDIDDFRQQSGIEGIPTLAVGNSYLKGFQSEQWNSELDIAGYPKASPYHLKTLSKPSPNRSKPEQ